MKREMEGSKREDPDKQGGEKREREFVLSDVWRLHSFYFSSSSSHTLSFAVRRDANRTNSETQPERQ